MPNSTLRSRPQTRTRLTVEALEDRSVPAVFRAGVEFAVNTVVANAQVNPSVAADALGNFATAWDSTIAMADTDVRARRFDLNGNPTNANDFLVNTTVANVQLNADVGSDSAGNFVVVWDSFSVGTDTDIFFQRYNSLGQAQGAQTAVNLTVADSQRNPRVAVAANGDFVVTWIAVVENGDATFTESVIARRFGAAGNALTGEIGVRSVNVGVAPGVIEFADVAAADAGQFVVTWSDAAGGNLDVLARRFAADGMARDMNPVLINTFTANDQRAPAVAADADGDYAIVWQGGGNQDGDGSGIFLRRFTDAGTPREAGEVQVNTGITGNQTNPDVALSGSGTVFVAWVDPVNGGDVILRQFTATGGPLSDPLVASTDQQAFQQTNPSLAVSDDGLRGVVVWQDNLRDGSMAGLFGLRFTATDTHTPPMHDPLNLVVLAGAGVGGPPRAVGLNGTNGQPQFTASPFPSNFPGGVRTASADFNADNVKDFVFGTGPGAPATVVVMDGLTNATLFTTGVLEGFTGGLFVAAGDLTGDGRADLVVTPDQGGGPRVLVFTGNGFTQIASFFGIDDASFRGGARPAVGDINGDRIADLAVSAGFLGGPRIAVFNGASIFSTPTRLVGDFFAFEQTLRNGAFVTIGDVNGDGFGDLTFGAGPGGGPRVLILSGAIVLNSGSGAALGAPLANFFGGNSANRGGIRVAAVKLDPDMFIDLAVGDGEEAGSRVTAYNGSALAVGNPQVLFGMDAFPGFFGGVFVG